jgi:membrane protease YdiL (CAAX protease family)
VAAIALVLFGFVVLQQVAAVIIVFVPHLFLDSIAADEWVVNSPVSSFIYMLLAESMILASLLWFLSYKRAPFWKTVGLQRPRWSHLGYTVIGTLVYFAIFALTLIAAQALPIDLDQQQSLPFEQGNTGMALILAGISLIVLPPLVEEILFRGFLYGTLRSNKIKVVAATIITSVFFGCLHLFGGAGGSLIWVAAIDTFVLSLVLCNLRERTGSIWPCIGVHAIKNGIVFVNLFILGAS